MQLNELKKEKVIAKMQEIEQIVAKLPNKTSIYSIDFSCKDDKTKIYCNRIGNINFMPYIKKALGVDSNIRYEEFDGSIFSYLDVTDDIVIQSIFYPVPVRDE